MREEGKTFMAEAHSRSNWPKSSNVPSPASIFSSCYSIAHTFHFGEKTPFGDWTHRSVIPLICMLSIFFIISFFLFLWWMGKKKNKLRKISNEKGKNTDILLFLNRSVEMNEGNPPTSKTKGFWNQCSSFFCHLNDNKFLLSLWSKLKKGSRPDQSSGEEKREAEATCQWSWPISCQISTPKIFPLRPLIRLTLSWAFQASISRLEASIYILDTVKQKGEWVAGMPVARC